MRALVLDTGALIALERNSVPMWARLRLASRRQMDVVVPSTALAQAWRARPSQALLAKALHVCRIASFDEVAREVGELCGRAHTDDVCDAHVALVAARSAEALVTSDPDDLRLLLDVIGGRQPALVTC